MPASIYLHGQSTLPDGRVLISGGGSAKCYIYTPSSNMWAEVASFSKRILYHGQSTLNDGRIFISGGNNPSLNTTYIYNIDTNEWSQSTNMLDSFTLHGQSTLLSGSVLVNGGWNNTNGGYNSSYIYTSNGTWSSVASLPVRLFRQGQSTLLNGKALVTGGTTNDLVGVNTCYVYTPSDAGVGSWDNTASMSAGIANHGQSTLANGNVLISGGALTRNSSWEGNTTSLKTTYVYTPTGTGLWNNASPLPTSIRSHGQSTLADGRVLVTGGLYESNELNTTYIYTPAGWVAVGTIFELQCVARCIIIM